MAALTEEEKEEVRLQFKRCDTNSDGKLSLAELTEVLQSAFQMDKTTMQKFFARRDLDKSGGISCEEFLNIYETEE